MSSRLAAVPSSAARLFGPQPCASGIVTSAIASEPTTATASGGLPSRIAGTTNTSTTRQADAEARRARARRAGARTAAPPRTKISGEHEHRRAALEVVEACTPVPATALGAGRRLGRLGHPDVVAGVEVRVEPAGGAELELHPPPGVGPALEPRRHELAALLRRSPGQSVSSHLARPRPAGCRPRCPPPICASASPGHRIASPATVATASTAAIAVKRRVTPRYR